MCTCACACIRVSLPLYRWRSQLSPIHAHAQHALSVSFILAYKKIKAIPSLFRNASSSRRGASSDRERTIATLQHGDLLASLNVCVCLSLSLINCVLLVSVCILLSFLSTIYGARKKKKRSSGRFCTYTVVVVLIGSLQRVESIRRCLE